MKILLLSELNSIHTKKWVSGLAASGCEVLVYGLIPPRDEFYKDLPNVKVEFSNFTNGGGPSKYHKLKYLTVRKRIKAIHKDFQPEIVHAHYASSYGLLGTFLKFSPYAISVWGDDVFSFPQESKLKNWLFKRNLKKADAIFSTSIVMAKETKKYTSKEVVVIPFGVDVNYFKKIESPREENSVVIGIVKTLEDKYGIKYLIDAFHILTKRFENLNLSLIIVGTGSKEKELKQQVTNLGLDEYVNFTGQIEHHQIPTVFNQMDIVAVPSILEGESFGVAAVEASACELPVVVCNVGGLPEVILDGKTGYVVEKKNPKQLAEKIAVLIDDPALRTQMGKAGRVNVLEKYNWQDNLAMQVEEYKKLLV